MAGVLTVCRQGGRHALIPTPDASGEANVNCWEDHTTLCTQQKWPGSLPLRSFPGFLILVISSGKKLEETQRYLGGQRLLYVVEHAQGWE